MILSPAALYARLARGEPTFLLDVRAPKEFERWRIEGPHAVDALNVPYTRILAEADEEDIPKAAVEYLEKNLGDRLPRHVLIVTVCAKGGASAPVAEGLRRAGFESANLEGGMRAWGDHYETVSIVDEGRLAILQVSRPARGCLSWVAISEGEAIVVDALRHVARYEDLLEGRGARLAAVVDTHAHADHLSGGRALAESAGVPYYLHPYDAVHPLDLLPATFAYEPLLERRSLSFGDGFMDVLHVPGHTLGACALLVEDSYLLAGDTLFVDGIARPDLGGHAEAWTPLHRRSLERLMDLGPGTLLLPGHFSSFAEADDAGRFAATMASVLERNDGARRVSLPADEFASYILSSLPAFPEAYAEIKRVNLGLRDAAEDRASELELGKNLCALHRGS